MFVDTVAREEFLDRLREIAKDQNLKRAVTRDSNHPSRSNRQLALSAMEDYEIRKGRPAKHAGWFAALPEQHPNWQSQQFSN